MFLPRKLTEEDNLDIQMATNYFGHFLLTSLLLKTLKQTADMDGTVTRIVNTSSSGHFAAGNYFNVEDLQFE